MRISSFISILLLVAPIEFLSCKNHRIVTDRGSHRPSVAMPVKGEKDRGVKFGTISRDEWLAKEYFGYLCGKC